MKNQAAPLYRIRHSFLQISPALEKKKIFHLTHLLMQPKCKGQAVKTRHMQSQAEKSLRGLALRTLIHIKSQKSFSAA